MARLLVFSQTTSQMNSSASAAEELQGLTIIYNVLLTHTGRLNGFMTVDI